MSFYFFPKQALDIKRRKREERKKKKTVEEDRSFLS